MKDKLLIISILSALTLLFIGCRKNSTNPECTISGIVPFEPYSDPVWHPNGQLLGFNHTPLVSISASGSAPCTWYYYAGNRDSSGFYVMNKDGTGFRRVTDFRLLAPSWSLDGKWLAFSLGSNICKMPFDGNTFDTSKIVRLTTIGGNFFPSWTANNDTIYYDSSNDTPEGTIFYSIWKMKSDGVGKTRLTQSAGIGETRQPFVGSNDKVYYFGYVSGVGYVPGQTEIFAMNKDGSNQTQITFNGQYGNRHSPKFWKGNLFYYDNGTLRVVKNNKEDIPLTKTCNTYDISVLGEIVYNKIDYDITKYNKQIGTLWIMNADGSNNRQLTFNNF